VPLVTPRNTFFYIEVGSSHGALVNYCTNDPFPRAWCRRGIFGVFWPVLGAGKRWGDAAKSTFQKCCFLKPKKGEDRKKLEKVKIAKIKLRRRHAPLSFSRDPSGWTSHALKFGREPSVFLAPRRAGKESKKYFPSKIRVEPQKIRVEPQLEFSEALKIYTWVRLNLNFHKILFIFFGVFFIVLECLFTVAKSSNPNLGKSSEKTNRIN